MKKTLLRLTLAASLVIGAAIALTQESHRLGLLQASAFNLSAPDIQKELALSEVQQRKIGDVFVELGAKQDKIDRSRKTEGQEASEKSLEQLEATMSNRLLEILTTAQSSRLRQIAIQQEGPLAIADPAVAKDLELTADQRMKVATIAKIYYHNEEEFSAALAAKLERIPQPQADTAAARSEYENLKNGVFEGMKDQEKALAADKKKSEAQVLATLSSSQTSKWKALLGKPFKSAG